MNIEALTASAAPQMTASALANTNELLRLTKLQRNVEAEGASLSVSRSSCARSLTAARDEPPRTVLALCRGAMQQLHERHMQEREPPPTESPTPTPDAPPTASSAAVADADERLAQFDARWRRAASDDAPQVTSTTDDDDDHDDDDSSLRRSFRWAPLFAPSLCRRAAIHNTTFAWSVGRAAARSATPA